MAATDSSPRTGTDARMVRTRAALRRALLRLLERKHFDQITVRDIAGEAKIGYATFFRHHESKSELLEDVAEEQIGNLMGLALPLLVADDTRGSCLALCRYVNEHRAIWSALLTGGAAGAMREEFLRQAMRVGSGTGAEKQLVTGRARRDLRRQRDRRDPRLVAAATARLHCGTHC